MSLEGFEKKTRGGRLPEGIVSLTKRHFLQIPKWAGERIDSKRADIWKDKENMRVALEFNKDGVYKIMKKGGMRIISLSGTFNELNYDDPEEVTYHSAEFDGDGNLIVFLNGEVDYEGSD